MLPYVEIPSVPTSVSAVCSALEILHVLPCYCSSRYRLKVDLLTTGEMGILRITTIQITIPGPFTMRIVLAWRSRRSNLMPP